MNLFLIDSRDFSSQDLKIRMKLWAMTAPPIMCRGISRNGIIEYIPKYLNVIASANIRIGNLKK